ncbi:MAG: hypothetical protein QW674_04015 [Candidatus Bathyarchaeia archaeon]
MEKQSAKNLAELEGFETLPGCIGYYAAPLAPNNCKACKVINLCSQSNMRFVSREALPIEDFLCI